MRAAVIGLGFGRFHAATLARMDDVDLVAVAQAHETDPPLSAFADRYGVRVHRDPVALLLQEDIDLVCLCNRPSARPALVATAAERGIAMLVEKPIAADVAAAEQVLATVRSAGVWAAVNFEMRALPAVQRLTDLLAAGTLGRPTALTLNYVMDPIPPDSWIWRPAEGGTPLWENSCHAFDLVRHLAGEPIDVHAFTTDAVDGATVALRTDRNVLCTIVCGAFGTEERGVPMRLDVYGTAGHATVTGGYHTFDRLEVGVRGTDVVTYDYPELRSTAEPGPFDEAPLLVPGLERVVQDLRDGRPPSPSVEDGVAAARIAQRIIRNPDAPCGRRIKWLGST